jgi:hypothetical protein
MKLYELASELAVINDTLIDAQGELTPDLETRLDELNLQLTEKATGLRKWLVVIENDETALETEISRLQRIKKVNENLRERLKEYVKKNMEVAGLKTIKTQIGTFSVVPNPISLECISEEMTPENFKETIPEKKVPNKPLIKTTLSEGYEVSGWKLVTDKTHLRIR